MAGNIGIKQANGDFYSILEENSTIKKRLILTTVHDGQKSVQIDLYRSQAKTMADAAYIGTLVVENITQKSKGEPSIEMTLSSTRDGSISASAVDLGNPENEHHLSVSLKSLEEDKNEYPDFELESENEQKRNSDPFKTPRKFPWIVVVIIGLVLAMLCLGLWYFLIRNKNNGTGQTISRPAQSAAAKGSPAQTVKEPAQAPAPQKTEPAPQPAAPAPQPTAPPPQAKPEPAPQPEQRQPAAAAPQPQQNTRLRQTAPVYSFNVPQPIPPEGVAYQIRWGDTLWDISEAFYRNPRLFTFIVRSNGIRNPNLIVPGTELSILPRN